MDFNKLIARVKGILTTPKTEWPVIAAEPATVADLYKNYVVILAALTPVATFIGAALFGTRIPLLGTVHIGMGALLTQLVLTYALGLAMTYIVALIIDALAPSFGGTKNPVQAFKSAAYCYTPVWIIGILNIIPGFGLLAGLLGLAAAIYAIYLLYLGLPHTMKCPPERAGGYAAVVIIIAFVLGIILGFVVAAVSGVGKMANMAATGALGMNTPDSQLEVDKDSPLGKLAAFSQKMEAAGKEMDAAKQSGDAQAQSEALGKIMGAALGGGDQVEALSPDVLKPFVPETLGGLKRTDFSAERNGALGMQVSEARATYSDGANRSLQLEVTDTGSAKGLMSLAGWAAVQNDRATDHGYEKTYKQNGRLVHEQWDSQSRYGEYGIVLGDRFAVKVTGNAASIDELKAAVASINLNALEALKNQGVKKG
jgi:hypothetical protein